MNLKFSFSLVLVVILTIIQLGHSERTKDQMYEHFDGKATCFRRLNATHQTGCSSKRDGSTGIIHFVEAEADLHFILKTGSAGDYMPVMPTVLLTRKTLGLLKNSDKISGVVLYSTNVTTPYQYSHELQCPNEYSNKEDTCKKASWNPHGTGILHEDLPFPIYYVDDEDDLGKIKDCFHKFNNYSYETQYTRSLCALELDSFMYATINTPTCRRRSNSKTNLNPVKFCDPLGGENVWASLFPIKNATKNDIPSASGKYIIVAARLDTTSLFNGAFPGAVNPVTGLVTLLATADLLKRMVGKDDSHGGKNVLFMLFNGESYDYIGSQRMVYDMEKGEFPMKMDPDIKNPVPLVRLEDISLFIELSQLSQISKYKAVYVHLADNTPEMKSFYAKLSSHKNAVKLQQHGKELPPSSLQSFYRANPNISGLVLADYGDTYVNMYYNSIYDNASNVQYVYYNMSEGELEDIPFDSIQRHTARISEMLALSLYEKVILTNYSGAEKARLELIDELYNCYLLDPDCKVHQAVQRKKLKDIPYSSYGFYVGVNVSPNVLTYVIGLALGWLTGDIVTLNKTCMGDAHNPMFQYFNMSKSLDNLNTTMCFRTTMNFTEAVSPAFEIEDYDWSSGKYSSWSESTWKDLTVRMFLKPSAAHERFTIAIGSITLIMSLIFVYFVKSRSHILFVTPENCSPTSC